MGKVAQPAKPHRGSSLRSASALAPRARRKTLGKQSETLGSGRASVEPLCSTQSLSTGLGVNQPSSEMVAHKILQHDTGKALKASLDDEPTKDCFPDVTLGGNELIGSPASPKDMDAEWATVSGRKRRSRSNKPAPQAKFVVEVRSLTDACDNICSEIEDHLIFSLEKKSFCIFPILSGNGAIVSFLSYDAYHLGLPLLEGNFCITHDGLSASSSSSSERGTIIKGSQTQNTTKKLDLSLGLHRPKTVHLRPAIAHEFTTHVSHITKAIHDNCNVRRFSIEQGTENDILIRFVTAGGAKYATDAIQAVLASDYIRIPKEICYAQNDNSVSDNPQGRAKTVKTSIISVVGELDRKKAIDKIRELLETKTNITCFNIEILDRGDYLIHFRSPTSKLIADCEFEKQPGRFSLKEFGKKNSYISSKKSWEISVKEVPPFITAAELASETGALKGFRRNRNVILRFSEKLTASNLCTAGLFFQKRFFRCEPWTATPLEFQSPKEACPRCLSKEHLILDCKASEPKCNKCGLTHYTSSCPEARKAVSRKRQTYAQALLGMEKLAKPEIPFKVNYRSYDRPSTRPSGDSLNSVAKSICETFSSISNPKEQISHVKDQIASLFTTDNDSSKESLSAESTELEKLQLTISALQEQVLALQTRILSYETKDQAMMSPIASVAKPEKQPRRKSAYSSAIKELTEKESKMDCLETQFETNAQPLVPEIGNISAYSRAAKVLAESPEITGVDKETTISLLMDFHRSLECRTDDDAMSSLYD